MLANDMNDKLPIASFLEQVRSKIQHYTDFSPETESKNLYADFPVEYGNMFAGIHETLMIALGELNARIERKNYHYRANDSRILKSVIEGIFAIEERFTTDGIFPFRIIQLYKDYLRECLSFLEITQGSTIPSTLEPIPLYTSDPIFEKLDVLSIPHYTERIKTGLKNIGNGGYAHVFSFKDVFLNKKFVLKRAKRELNEKELMRFKNEHEVLHGLSSPYIVEVYTYNEENHEYIMEAMDDSLARYIEKNNNSLSLSERRKICVQIFKGFKYIHSKRYLHRDVHANNVLVKQYMDGTLIVKLADFGLAKIPDSELTSTLTSMKGAVYNDPDLRRVGFANYELPHEIYSLCSLIYFVLTGKKVSSKDWNIHKIQNQELHNFMAKGLSNNIEERFRDVDEVERATKEVIKSMERF